MRRLPGLTYANVMATIAVFLALGGASYAALQLPAHSVGTRQLKPDAVTSSKVHNRSLRAIDFARGQLPAGARGLTGATGRDGTNGRDGTTGPPGPTVIGFAHIGGGGTLDTVSETVVADTSTSPLHSGPITTTFPGRWVLNASVELLKAGGAESPKTGEYHCRLAIGSGTTFVNAGADARATLGPVPATARAYATVGLTAVIDEPPGTYDIRVLCAVFPSTGTDATTGVWDHADLSAVVGPQPAS
jgi:hypothetical protein